MLFIKLSTHEKGSITTNDPDFDRNACVEGYVNKWLLLEVMEVMGCFTVWHCCYIIKAERKIYLGR